MVLVLVASRRALRAPVVDPRLKPIFPHGGVLWEGLRALQRLPCLCPHDASRRGGCSSHCPAERLAVPVRLNVIHGASGLPEDKSLANREQEASAR